MDITTIISAIGALGGLELIKYIHTRRNSSRIAKARAEGEEFRMLREYIEFLQTQLIQKEERFAEQTLQVRRLNQEIINLTNEMANLRLTNSTQAQIQNHATDR